MDRELGRRLERAEGGIGVAYVGVRRRLTPEVGAACVEIDGAYALFDGVDSLMNQSFAIGMTAPLTAASLDAYEGFFAGHGSAAQHEVSSLAGIDAWTLLAGRGYRPIDLSTVLVTTLDQPLAIAEQPGLRVRICAARDEDRWVAASMAGWSEWEEGAAQIETFARTTFANPAMHCFLVEDADGGALATGALGVIEGVALLAGASTVPAARGRGAQALLLAARLAEARRIDCELAMIAATPGSTSQRNAERNGFRVAYTRTKFRQG